MAAPAVSADTPRDRASGRTFVALWLGVSIIATPFVAVFLGPAIPPGNGSAEAQAQVFDNQVLVSVCTPICAFVLLFIAYAAVSFRSRTAALVDGAPVRGNMRLQVLWMVVTGVTVLTLASFGSYELVKDGAGGGQGPSAAFVSASDKAHALDVQVIGQQWEFTYRYPSAGGLETPHLVLPANTVVRLHVTSLDAIHSFWAYQLGVKADANPGSDNIVYVTTRKPLTFDVRCAELCGLWHGYMSDTGEVVSQTAFASWLAQEKKTFAPILKYLPPYATSYVPDPQLRAG